MPERPTIVDCAFGSRDPLPPRVASLDEEPTSSDDAEVVENSPRDVYDTNAKSLRLSGASNPAPQPFASMTSGTCNSTAVAPQQKLTTRTSPTFLAVPTLRLNTQARWSDVVALGSEAFRLRATTKEPDVAMPYNILVAIMKKADVFDALMLNCPDFPTLFALVASCTKAKRTFERHSQGIIKAMLNRMPQELRYLTVALIGINGSPIDKWDSIKTLMDTWLGLGPKPLTNRLQKDPIEIIRKLACSFSAIDLFMEVIPKNCVNNFTDYKAVAASREGLDYYEVADWYNEHPLLQQTEWSDVPDDTEWDVPGLSTGPQEIALPLTEGEKYRIKRALLRYEIFCALFYLGPDRYFDTRHHPHRFNQDPDLSRQYAFREDQIIFLNEYVNPWEVGELAVITHFMYDLVRNAYFDKYKTLRYNEASKCLYGRIGHRHQGQNRHVDHEEVVDEFDNHMVWSTSQGLNLLRKIYDDRKMGYVALTEKHWGPRYRLAECFVPFERCANRRWWSLSGDPDSIWKPRKVWSDTSGMELPSKGWLGKSPPIDDDAENTAYWGDKWMRKIGYSIWDREYLLVDEPFIL